jgi:WD40 repeat protein
MVGHSNVLSSLALDQKYLYSSAMDKTVKRWNISSGFFEKEYVGHTDAVLDVKIREDRLYSCSYDTYVRVWDKDEAKMTSYFKCKFY